MNQKPIRHPYQRPRAGKAPEQDIANNGDAVRLQAAER
jgi:hypothetical protein